MESRPTQAVFSLVGLAAEKVIPDRYILSRLEGLLALPVRFHPSGKRTLGKVGGLPR
ncbi:MAG: hypothetical protein R6U98_25610 [Pirellulaceae bacterium]